MTTSVPVKRQVRTPSSVRSLPELGFGIFAAKPPVIVCVGSFSVVSPANCTAESRNLLSFAMLIAS